MKKKQITIKEHESIGLNTQHDLSKNEFESLKSFVLKSRDSDDYSCEYLRLGYKNGEEVLTAKNFVGIIETKHHIIEILPKIYDGKEDKSVDKTRKIFLKMLKSVKDLPFRHFNSAALKNCSLHLFEIFVLMFLEELGRIVKSGLKSQYVSEEENLSVLKGKIKWSEHLRKNLVHKERVFVEYDEFSPNRPENRILKKTIQFLAKKEFSNTTNLHLRQYEFIFDEIPESTNIANDFAQCGKNRTTKSYENILPWCRIFLQNESFQTASGKNDVYALLFPMEKVFECYVADFIKKNIESGWSVKLQEGSKYLVEKPGKFRLRPDIILEKNNEKIIIDTKWKMIDLTDEKNNYKISQADLYQMFAYAKKYGSKKVVVIYPLNEKFKEEREFDYGDGIKLTVFPWKFEENNKNEFNQIGELSNVFSSPLQNIDNLRWLLCAAQTLECPLPVEQSC